MTEKIPVAVWQGDIAIMGIKLKCFVLDDGRRIIDADFMAQFIEAMNNPDAKLQESDTMEMVKFLRGDGIPTYSMKG